VAIDTSKMPPAAPVEEEDRAAESLHALSHRLSRVALHNVNVKIDDTAVCATFPPA
jgi:translocation and assembly module TamB